VALGGEIVDLVGLGLLDDPDQVGRVGQVAVMQEEVRVLLVRVLVDMVDPLGVELARSALDAVDRVAFLEQEFGQILSVLAGDAGDECGLAHGALRRLRGEAFARPRVNP
jgi:hypothetical protein